MSKITNILKTAQINKNNTDKGNNVILIKGYCDNDYGNSLIDKRSISGYIFSLILEKDLNIIKTNIKSFISQLQKTIILLIKKTEYIILKKCNLKNYIFL